MVKNEWTEQCMGGRYLLISWEHLDMDQLWLKILVYMLHNILLVGQISSVSELKREMSHVVKNLHTFFPTEALYSSESDWSSSPWLFSVAHESSGDADGVASLSPPESSPSFLS